MNKTELTEIKKKIEQEINNTKISIEKYKNLTKPISPENAIGRVSRMDAINNKSVIEEVLRKSEEKLKELIFSKNQIEKSDDYGKCIRCKKQINIKRLMIIPYVRKCMHCA
jgi:DnaK suppressor protein